jgi:hypothetical protein
MGIICENRKKNTTGVQRNGTGGVIRAGSARASSSVLDGEALPQKRYDMCRDLRRLRGFIGSVVG